MERKEMLKRLSEIKVLSAGITITWDMGIIFDVMTSRGACTNMGNIGNWPCIKLPISPELLNLKQRIINDGNVTTDDILNVPECKAILTYDEMYRRQSWVVEDEILSQCADNLKTELAKLDTSNDYFYAFADLEDWGDSDVKLFVDYDELCMYFGERFGTDDCLYENMSDEELKTAYEEAENNGWEGVSYKSYLPKKR